MDSKAILKARSRLRVAQKTIVELSACQDFESFTDLWYTFLTAVKNIYTVLEQGAKSSPQSRQWFGGKKEERKRDDLLQYIFQARNDDEHGIEPIAEHVPGAVEIGVNKEGYSTNINSLNITISDGNVNINHITTNDDKPVLVEIRGPRAQLIAVRDRGGRLYSPPTVHKSSPLDNNSPLNVASLAYLYLESLVEEAERLA